ncbi:transmembrane protein [Anaeramoeba flamelloides]|uniref:Transmembrane protein n=1 Tax=Anaeramoeba flamelloides TaxID=1746091 RepID=A0AAV7Z5D9_9EUKA|nr:transmembrane protein [Anaeramoeba flamelloides]
MSRHPNCIIWTPIFPITCFVPFVGHLAVTDSGGNSWEFAGSKYIRCSEKGSTIFGKPTKYIQLDLQPLITNKNIDNEKHWDSSIEQTTIEFEKQNYNLFTNNCHDHTARVLDLFGYQGKNNWHTFASFKMVWLVLKKSKLDGVGGFLKTYFFFFVVVILYVLYHKILK